MSPDWAIAQHDVYGDSDDALVNETFCPTNEWHRALNDLRWHPGWLDPLVRDEYRVRSSTPEERQSTFADLLDALNETVAGFQASYHLIFEADSSRLKEIESYIEDARAYGTVVQVGQQYFAIFDTKIPTDQKLERQLSGSRETTADQHRRQLIGEAIVEGYRRVPETDEELQWAEQNARWMISEEPW